MAKKRKKLRGTVQKSSSLLPSEAEKAEITVQEAEEL